MDKISPQSFKENKTQATVMTTAASDEGVWQPLLFTSHRVQHWQRKERISSESTQQNRSQSPQNLHPTTEMSSQQS